MPAWSRFILTVFVPHWLDELEDEQRREREAAAKRKSFNSTKAHGNGGSSNARDGNACSSSREGNGGSSAAGDDAVADNLAPVMPTVKRRRTSRDKQSSNISTVSNEESYFECESMHSCDVSESVDVEAGSEAGSSRLQSCLGLNVKVVVGGSERENEEEKEKEIDGALANGRSESSVLFRERENDVDVDVRARKKRKLTNEELALPGKVVNMYGEHSPAGARPDGVVEAAPQDLLSPIATTVQTGDRESEASELGGLVNISQHVERDGHDRGAGEQRAGHGWS